MWRDSLKNLENPQKLAKSLEFYSMKRKLEKNLTDPSEIVGQNFGIF